MNSFDRQLLEEVNQRIRQIYLNQISLFINRTECVCPRMVMSVCENGVRVELLILVNKPLEDM